MSNTNTTTTTSTNPQPAAPAAAPAGPVQLAVAPTPLLYPGIDNSRVFLAIKQPGAVLFNFKPDDVRLAEHLLTTYTGDDMSLEMQPAPVVVDGHIHGYDQERGVWVNIEADLHRRAQFYSGVNYQVPGGTVGTIHLNGNRSGSIVFQMRCKLEDMTEDFSPRRRRFGVATASGFLPITSTGKLGMLEPNRPENYCRWCIDAVVPEGVDPAQLFNTMYAQQYEDSYLKMYLDGLINNDPDGPSKVKLLGQVAFSTLFGLGPRFGRALLVIGDKGTGKSQYLKMLEALVDSSAVTSVQPEMLHARDQVSVAALAGKALNIVHELSARHPFGDENYIKAIINGEGVRGRALYKDGFVMYCVAMHVFATNVLPNLGGHVSEAFWDRWMVVEFTQQRRRKAGDVKNIGGLIAEHERGLLLAWALQWGPELLENEDYSLVRGHQETLEIWKDSGNSTRSWVRDDCMILPDNSPSGNWERTSDSFRRYQSWCNASGYEPVNKREFTETLRGLDIRKVKNGVLRYNLSRRPEGV